MREKYLEMTNSRVHPTMYSSNEYERESEYYLGTAGLRVWDQTLHNPGRPQMAANRSIP